MKLLPLLCLLTQGFGPTSALENRPGVVTVSEGADALLPCGSGHNIDKFDWKKDDGKKEDVFFYEEGKYYGHGIDVLYQSEQFRGRVVFFKDELKSGNASIKIPNTRLEDNGTYTCVLFKPQRPEVTIRLNVGAAQVPHVKPIHVENSRWLVQCKVHGVPKPEMEWRNSAGKPLLHSTEDKHSTREHKDASGRFHVELNVNVTRSDTYTCVATQRSIYHQISNTIEVHIEDSVAVAVGDDVILPCSLDSKENIHNMAFSWKKDLKEVFIYTRDRVEEDEPFKGRLTHFQHELKFGNASIKIHNAQTFDSGSYTCIFPDIQKSHIKLHVVSISSHSFQSPCLWMCHVCLILWFMSVDYFL